MEMMPKQIDDFIPLIGVETSVLEAYKYTLKTANVNSIGSNHPIYYFSERLNVSATLMLRIQIYANAKFFQIFISDSIR